MHRILYLLLPLALALSGCTEDLITPGIGEGSLTESTTALEQQVMAEVAVAQADIAAEIAANEAVFNRRGHVTVIPAGSENALAAAIAAAPSNGIIRLEAGDHFQSGTLTISKPINIIGNRGARLLVSGVGPFPTVAPQIVAGIRVYKTEFVRIRNLELVPVGGEGGTAVLVQEAPYTYLSGLVAEDWQIGVVAEKSARLFVNRSVFTGSSQWQTNPAFPVFGVVVVNGPRATLHGNTITNTVFGVWACDKLSKLSYNNFSGNVNGIELCKVPVSFPLDGELIGSEFPATRWLVYHNDSKANFNNGIEVIDGANTCYLVNNTATGNGALDYEFAGETGRYGFTAPTSSRNFARLAPDSRWADCGEGNRILTQRAAEDWTCF